MPFSSATKRSLRSALVTSSIQTSRQNVQYYFPTATTACYSFWQYELCDVYLEYIKPIMRDGSEAEMERTRQVD